MLSISKYNRNKNKNQEVLKLIAPHVSSKTANAIKYCGNHLEFIADKELEHMKLHKMISCKNRFCPMCAWRLAQKDALKISIMMDYIEQEHKKAFIFLTLTAANVKGDELGQAVTDFNLAFKRLMKRKEIETASKGYIRKLEITYNAERNDYHPHFHCVIAVNKSYFSSRDYIKQEDWLELWREAMRDQSITQVDVRRVKKTETGKEIKELAKYSAKDSDYTESQEVFDTFYNALKGRQLITYNGLFAEASKKYEKHELDYMLKPDNTDYYWLLLYRWGKGEYAEQERRQLTNDEIINIELEQLRQEPQDN